MSSSRRATTLNTARANALQLLMDKARARAGKPASSTAAPIAPAAGSSTASHAPTKRKLVSRAQREAGSAQSSPQAGQTKDVDADGLAKVKAEPRKEEEMAYEDEDVEDHDEEHSPFKLKRRRLNSGADLDAPSTLIQVQTELSPATVSDDWLAFGDDVEQQLASKDEPAEDAKNDDGEDGPLASSPTAGRRPRRLHTKSDMERKAQQQREQAMALAEEFDVDQDNIVESPRKSRRGGIRDRIERARNRGKLSMDTSERLPASITNESSSDVHDNEGGDDRFAVSGSDSDDLIIVPKLEPTLFSRPSLGPAPDSGDDHEDGDDSWIVDDEDADAIKNEGDSDSDSNEAPLAFHNLDSLQWYTLYLEYLARLVLDPKTYQRLEYGVQRPDEQDDPLAAAYRKINDMIQLRLKSMYSTVWREHLLDSIHSHPLCRRTSNPSQNLCEACNRAERNTCARLTFRGNPYDPNTFRPLPPESESESEPVSDYAETPRAPRNRGRRIASDSDSDADRETKPTSKSKARKLARSLVSPHYSVGRFCALRVHGYHQLYHAKYHTYLAVRDRMAQLAGASVFGCSGDWPPASISAAEGEMLLESLLTGREGARWVRERYDEFQGMLSEADDVLCNRVGALSKN